MRVLSGLDALAPLDPGGGAVGTVGVFDGVHRGHRQLLYELTVWAGEVGRTAFAVTFDRHPVEVLRGEEVPLIQPLSERLVELGRHGVESIAVLDFAEIRELTAREFLEDVLKARLGCGRFLLGFDSRLGRDRADAHRLPAIGEACGVEVRVASPVLDRDGRKIGSSAIREAVREGDLDRAANLLGHPYKIRGTVERGAGRGKGLGTATANLGVAGRVLPPDGVYLVRVFWRGRTAGAVRGTSYLIATGAEARPGQVRSGSVRPGKAHWRTSRQCHPPVRPASGYLSATSSVTTTPNRPTPSMSAAESSMAVKIWPPASGWRAIDSVAELPMLAMPRAAPITTSPAPMAAPR